jgi:hypothetical protein
MAFLGSLINDVMFAPAILFTSDSVAVRSLEQTLRPGLATFLQRCRAAPLPRLAQQMPLRFRPVSASKIMIRLMISISARLTLRLSPLSRHQMNFRFSSSQSASRGAICGSASLNCCNYSATEPMIRAAATSVRMVKVSPAKAAPRFGRSVHMAWWQPSPDAMTQPNVSVIHRLDND